MGDRLQLSCSVDTNDTANGVYGVNGHHRLDSPDQQPEMRELVTKFAALNTASEPRSLSGDSSTSQDSDGFSIRQSLSGATVFLTGCTGYVGSLVLEQLLRCCPGVSKVYVLVRDRRGQTAHERVRRLMRSALYHRVRDREELTSKVVVVEGDMGSPDLGIAPGMLKVVQDETTIIIHSAADIALEDPIQATLKANYCGTQRLLEAAQDFRRLASFVYISTAFSNVNQPRYSTVLEQMYPLMLGDEQVDPSRLVSEFLALDERIADVKAKALMKLWGFNNTYCLGKHLTEQMVVRYHGRPAQVAIVRPSLISAVAGEPYPGYVGNLAGPAGALIAVALGFYNRNSGAWLVHHVLDCVPGDVTSSLILAAAAATVGGPPRANALVLHAATSTTCPLSHVEGYAMAYSYFKRYPAPFKLIMGQYWRLHKMKKEYVPKKWKCKWAMRMTTAKVGALSALMRMVGRESDARKLSVGLRAWKQHNTPEYDISLFFSVKGAQALQARLVPEEQDMFKLTWRGDWHRFHMTYAAALMHRHFRQAPPPVTLIPHDYVYVADLPCLPAAAGAAAGRA